MRRPLLALAVTFAPACTKGTDTADTAATAALDEACVVSGDRPAGWGEATHSKDAEADYDGVFDLSRMQLVNRYYVMTKILARTSPKDHLKLLLWELFGLVSSGASWQGLLEVPQSLFGRLAAIPAMIQMRNKTA